MKYIFLVSLLICSLSSGVVKAGTIECSSGLVLSVAGKAQNKNQKVALSDSVNLEINQYLFVETYKAARIAKNLICQKIDGASYTGKSDEWTKFFRSALDGLVKAKYENVQFTLVGIDERSYVSENSSQEYVFQGTKDDNEQVIYNLAVLSENKQSLLTISVSGNIAEKEQIQKEYQKLVTSLKETKL